MSSLNDVQNAMVSVINAAIYPDGFDQPSIVNTPVFVNPGDFQKQDLDTGLLAGNIYVAVFAVHGMSRPTTRLRREFIESIKNTETLTLTVVNNVVTIGGTITPGEAAMIIVNDVGYSVKVLVGSTVNSIASALAVLIPNATAVDNVLTVAGVFRVIARVSVQGTAREILFSHEGVFRARVIAPNNELRESIGNAIELAFGLNGYYMSMPDGIKASIKPNRIMELNPYELDNAFLRDYLYLVEYHTVYVGTYQSIEKINIDTSVTETPIT